MSEEEIARTRERKQLSETQPLDFWNVNVPSHLHTKACPPFLQYAFANDKDRNILATPDASYTSPTWPEVQDIVRSNRIDLFQRVPSQLRLYHEYCAKLKQRYGTVMNFVMQERLRWSDQSAKGKPFEFPEDVKILYNDWPYNGMNSKIVHLVVWVKFQLEEDPATGDLTPQTRDAIEAFVRSTFCQEVDADRVVWFRNWASLKSIHAVEHFHVMLYGPKMEFVKEITGDDVPLATKVGRGDAV